MKYDFDTVIDRRNGDSVKWHGDEKELPMWIADMDFKVAPEIQKEFQKKIDHGIFGYTRVTDEWYAAYQNWWKEVHQCELQKEWLLYCNGIVPGITASLRVLTSPSAKVVLLSPVYNMFFVAVQRSGREVVECPLAYQDGTYTIDYEDLEKKLKDEKVEALILCNPHNPSGNIWTKEELMRIDQLVEENHCLIISDEIHCDITEPGYTYTPYPSLSEQARNHSITCIAPTKTFNIAGFKSSALCIPNETMRKKVEEALMNEYLSGPNAFGVIGAIACFQHGKQWRDEMCEYVFQNRAYAEKYLKENVPTVLPIASHSTYLMWIDISKLPGDSNEFSEYLKEDVNLFLNSGFSYGMAGKHFVRMNLACPRVLLEEGLERFKKGVEDYLQKKNSVE